MVIAIGIWSGVKHLVAGTDKLEIFSVRLALVPWGFWGLLVAFNAPGFLVQRRPH